MSDEIHLHITTREMDFIASVLGAVPTIQTAQADMLGLIPKLVKQAQASLTKPQVNGEEVPLDLPEVLNG